MDPAACCTAPGIPIGPPHGHGCHPPDGLTSAPLWPTAPPLYPQQQMPQEFAHAHQPSAPILCQSVEIYLQEAIQTRNTGAVEFVMKEVRKAFGRDYAISQLKLGAKLSVASFAICMLGYLLASLAAGFLLSASTLNIFILIAGVLSFLFLIEAGAWCINYRAWNDVDPNTAEWIAQHRLEGDNGERAGVHQRLTQLATQAEQQGNHLMRAQLEKHAKNLKDRPGFGLIAGGAVLLAFIVAHLPAIASTAGRAAAANERRHNTASAGYRR